MSRDITGPQPDEAREKEEDKEEEDYQRRVSRAPPMASTLGPYDIPGPSHQIYSPELEQVGQAGSQSRLQAPVLHTRGPGRPRIHPPKPAGVSRPRGRPKGSKNKKPRKKIEKPPKRRRGRPRKWPPELWKGFQHICSTAAGPSHKPQYHHEPQPLEHQHQPLLQHQPEETPGPSHMYMEPARESMMGMQGISGVLPHHMTSSQPPPLPTQHPMPPSHHYSHQQAPQYMQNPLETEQPQELTLMMPRLSMPQELVPHQPQMLPPMMLGVEEHPQEHIADPDELLWIQQHEEFPHQHSSS